MTWIKTVRMDEDDRVKTAMEAQRKLYPIEYATPIHPVNDGETSGIVASHTLLPTCSSMPSARLARSCPRICLSSGTSTK